MIKKCYEKPQIEIIEFEVNDTIASSTDTGAGAVGTEALFD